MYSSKYFKTKKSSCDNSAALQFQLRGTRIFNPALKILSMSCIPANILKQKSRAVITAQLYNFRCGEQGYLILR